MSRSSSCRQVARRRSLSAAAVGLALLGSGRTAQGDVPPPAPEPSAASSSAPTPPAPWPRPRVELRKDLRLDVPLTVALVGYAAVSEVLNERLAPDRCTFCEGSLDHVNGLDRAIRSAFVREDPRPARITSDVLAFGVVPLAAGGFVHVAAAADGRGDETPTNLLLVAEATGVALALTQVVKYAVARGVPTSPRIGTWPRRARDVRARRRDDRVSFFSGHASTSFALAASTATVATMRRYRSAPLLWASGMSLAVATSYLRLAGDKHYFTDVTVGGAVNARGRARALGVPRPQGAPREGTLRVMPTITPGGLGLGGVLSLLRRRVAAISAALALVATADRAEAYSIETLVTPGATNVSRPRRSPRRAPGRRTPGRLAATTGDRAPVEDRRSAFPDTVAPRRDLGAVALLVGVREPDLRGNEPTDFHDLSPVHAAEETQAEHCLRRAADDEPAGARVALAACRAFVERELAAAAEAAPGGRRTRLPVFLAVQGRPGGAPRGVRARGFALHALQDAFTAYRTNGAREVVTVSTSSTKRAARSTRAGRPPTGRRSTRARGVTAPGRASRGGRGGVHGGARGGLRAGAVARGARGAGRRGARRGCRCAKAAPPPTPSATRPRRRSATPASEAATSPGRSRPPCPRPPSCASSCSRPRGGGVDVRAPSRAAVVLGLGLGSRPARADEARPAAPVPKNLLPTEARDESRLALSSMVGASLDRPAFFVSGGVRYRASARWLVGLDLEWNPWATLHAVSVRPGTLAARHGRAPHPMRSEALNPHGGAPRRRDAAPATSSAPARAARGLSSAFPSASSRRQARAPRRRRPRTCASSCPSSQARRRPPPV